MIKGNNIIALQIISMKQCFSSFTQDKFFYNRELCF